MNPAVHIFDSVVHDLMGVVAGEPVIREKRVGIECRSRFHMLFDFRLEGCALPIRNDSSTDLSATLKDAHDRRLVLAASSGDGALPFADVHVPSLATDESLIRFNFAGELRSELVLQGLANPVQHEPRGFLSDAEGASHFARTNAVLAIAEHPVSAHPLIQTEGRVFKDRAHFEAELLLAAFAEPDAARLDERVILAPAARARNYTVRPAKVKGILKAAIWVAEVDDRVLEC